MTHRYEAMEKPKSEVASIVLGAVLIAMLSGTVLSIFYLMIDGCRQRRKDRATAALNASRADLSLDPDGETLKQAETAETASTDYAPPKSDADVQFA